LCAFRVTQTPEQDGCDTEDFHVSFEFFGGVPCSILYDNLKLAVASILGDGRRQRTRSLSELQSHYLFADRFGRPGKGNDKGQASYCTSLRRCVASFG
jgi:transposase